MNRGAGRSLSLLTVFITADFIIIEPSFEFVNRRSGGFQAPLAFFAPDDRIAHEVANIPDYIQIRG